MLWCILQFTVGAMVGAMLGVVIMGTIYATRLELLRREALDVLMLIRAERERVEARTREIEEEA